MPYNCRTRKRGYPSKADAKHAARRLRQYGHAKGHAYHCPECGEWHLTTADADTRTYLRRLYHRR